MSDIGIEVGQKMRSAIKAKLMELECYVDDELPDYIMVMVANKRTKSQMNEDLQLFLGSKTSVFVDWLHIVLKKLKEVHVTNPNVFKKSVKRKSLELTDVKNIKKEKKETKSKKLKKKESQNITLEDQSKSLTDDLPLNINKLSESRKIMLMQDCQSAESSHVQNNKDYGFDIPSLSEINSSSENELKIIEKQIRNVKSRLGLIVQSDSDEDFLNIKAEPDDLFPNEHSLNKKERKKMNENKTKINLVNPISASNINNEPVESICQEVTPKPKEHTRIIFDVNDKAAKKKSVLERLGKRHNNEDNDVDFRTGLKKSKINLNEIRKEEEEIFGIKKFNAKAHMFSQKDGLKWSDDGKSKFDKNRNVKREKTQQERKESILRRLGVMSKVAIPDKKVVQENVVVEEDENLKSKEVPSMVKVKPRVIPPNSQQANKNLLLKAVAEAQRSVAQTPSVGTNSKPDALFTKKFQQKSTVKEHKLKNKEKDDFKNMKIMLKSTKRKLPDKEKSRLKNIIEHIVKDGKDVPLSNEDLECSEVSDNKVDAILEQFPNLKAMVKNDSELNREKQIVNQNFIVTLDGIDKNKYEKATENKDDNFKAAVIKKKSPSPIIFENVSSPIKNSVPDKLHIVHASPIIKNKERCKYWPSCRHGEKCEYVHPSLPCKMFPQCKFGDKCLYIHPSCKFESSCTRRDCLYSHASGSKLVASRIVPSGGLIQVAKQLLQTCKFFPHCNNSHCTFYHPRPCKFGKFCKSQSECNFSHTYVPKNSNFTWRNDFKS